MTDDLVMMRREQFRDGKFIGADEWSYHQYDISAVGSDDDFYCLKRSERHNDHFVVTRTKGLNIKTLEWNLEWQDDRVYIIFTNAGNTERYVEPIIAGGTGNMTWDANFKFEGYQIAFFQGRTFDTTQWAPGTDIAKEFAAGILVGRSNYGNQYLVKSDDLWLSVHGYEVDRQNLTMLPAPDYEPIPFDEVG